MFYLLEFFVQGLAPADYLPEIPFDAHILLSCPGLGIFYYRLGQTHLARKLECKGVSGEAGLKLEERFYAGCIEHHGAVYHACLRPGGIEFQIGVVRGNHAIAASFVYFREYRFRYGPAGCRFRPGAELVYEHHGA